jgi:protein ImuA
MSRAQPQSAPVSQPLRSRLHLLRQEIAGIDNSANPPAEAPLRIPLGHARLDRMLSGGLKLGGLHEIVASCPGDRPAAAGFALALAAGLCAARKRRPLVWIGEDFAAFEQGALYGPGLALFGIDPDCLLLVHAADAKEALWAMEEALKCRAPGAVIGEIFSAKFYDLAASRRLVLTAQKNAIPALLFLAGIAGADALSSGADTRFEVRANLSPHRAAAARHLPLPGIPAWSVRIAKARAGPAGFALDRAFHPVSWTEVSFRDALSFSVSAFSGDGSDRSPGEARQAFGA